MTAKGSEQWIQQAVSVQLTRVAIPWQGSWAHHTLLYGMRGVMTQFSVGVLPHRRHGTVIIHFGERLAVQKEIMSDRKGESFNIASHPEREREGEKNQNQWAILTLTLPVHVTTQADPALSSSTLWRSSRKVILHTVPVIFSLQSSFIYIFSCNPHDESWWGKGSYNYFHFTV